MERPAKRAKISVEGQEAERAPQPECLNGLGPTSEILESTVKSPTITFYTLPYELRSEVYILAGIPTKTIFDLMQKPIFQVATYLSEFRELLEDAADVCGVVVGGSQTDDYPVPDNASDNTQTSGGPNDTQLKAEDEQSSVDEEWPPTWLAPIDKDDAMEDLSEDPDRSRTLEGLLLTSRQVRDEVLDILYGQNIFRVDLFKAGRHPNAFKDVEKGKLERIQHIMMVLVDPSTAASIGDYHELVGHQVEGNYRLKIDKKVWGSMISALTSLRILVAQPRLPLLVARDGHLPFCQDLLAIDEWDYSLEQLFRYLKVYLLPETSLLIDLRGWPTERLCVALTDLEKNHANRRETYTEMGDLYRQGARLCPEHYFLCGHSDYNESLCGWCEMETAESSQERKQQIRSGLGHATPSNDDTSQPDNIVGSPDEHESDHGSHSSYSESEDSLEDDETS